MTARAPRLNGALTGEVAATMGTSGSPVNSAGPQVMQPIVVHGTQNPCVSTETAFALGRNNGGEIDPLAAADLAKKLGVRIYTIGAATLGQAPVRVHDPLGFDRQVMVRVDLDEDSLREIALRTGGQFFRATDADSLANIFNQIDRLEKNDAPARAQVEYRELFDWPLLIGILCLLLFLWEEHGPRRERP